MSASSRHSFIFLHLFFLLIFISGWSNIFAQSTYMMSNNYVTDCEGILLDSEEGPEEGQYNHNEDYTFTICIEGATEIVLSFDFFATEVTYDILTIYDGPDVNSPVIAALTGVIQPVPVLVATSGCLTLHFVSDDNIVATGWSAEWSVEIEEPIEPILTVEPDIECPLTSAIFSFDYPIDCSNFDPSNFSIAGPGNSTIASINVLDCDPNTGLGQVFEVVFNPPLSEAGSYRLLYSISIQDACDEWHDIEANVLFELNNCPFNVYIDIGDHGCAGDCGTVRANIVGGNSSTYDYQWSHTPLNQSEVEVCTEDPFPVSVVVTDPLTMQSVSADFIYIPLENPVFLNPLDHDTICASSSNHQYLMSIPGGEFYSRIIPDGERTSGVYQFWRWSNANGLQQDIVTYYAPNGCSVEDTFYTLPINAGSIQAACLGSDPFVVNGGTPVGGEWVGPHISPDGTFDPAELGSFIVTYQAPNGCNRNKRVNVDDGIIMPDIDTICSSVRIWIEAEPYGGRWSGPAIINSVNGRLDPWRVTPNQTYTYYYELNGCIDSMDIYIQELWSGPDRQVCSSETTLTLNQSGNWTGPATYNPTDSSFDISNLGPGSYNFTLSLDECSDRFELEIITPRIDVYRELFFCLEDNWHSIFDFIDIRPGNGFFTGASIAENNGNWYFNPSLVGPGTHMLYYEALGCLDSVNIIVEEPSVIPDYLLCELNPIIQLQATPPGGSWEGNGFIDPQSGLYDPELVGAGIYDIYYYAPSGCMTPSTIEIFSFEEVSIIGLDQQYCFGDTNIILNLSPPGGEFYINGVLSSPEFNPAQLGEGNHEITYTRGSGSCESTEREFISIMPPISGVINASNDSICSGQNTVIDIATQGGVSNLSATWDQGLGFGTSHIVNPTQSTWYHVEITDGCSDPYTDSIRVHVFPNFNINLDLGPEVCFEDTTYATIITPDPNNYEVLWLTNPPVLSDMYEDRPGFYSIEVTELSSGCIQDFEIQLPGATPLKANFELNPKVECINIIDNRIEIIDLSTGFSNGWIDFGDGSPTVPLGQGLIAHEYQEIGDFVVTQYVSNDIGCADTLSLVLCVENKIRYYIPTAFSPNQDEINDLLFIDAFGVEQPAWSTYDRWGNKLFESVSLDEGWNGIYKGKVLQPGVYVIKFEFTDPVSGRRHLNWQTVTIIL